MFLHFKTWEVTEYFIEAAERPHLLLSQSDSLNFEAIVWSILMNQELRGPSCLMPCIRKDHHPCHVPLLPRWPRRTAPGMAPNRNRNAAKLAGSRIRLRRCCSDNFLPLQHLKPVIFNQIALGQAFTYKAPTSSSWEVFKDLLKVRSLCHCTNWDTGGANGSGWSHTVISIITEPIILDDVGHYGSAEPSILQVLQSLSQNRGHFVCQRFQPGPPTVPLSLSSL